MSGIDFVDENGKTVRSIRKGAVEAIQAYVEQQGGSFPQATICCWWSLFQIKGELLF